MISQRMQLLNASSPTLYTVVTGDVCVKNRGVCVYVFCIIALAGLVWRCSRNLR